MFLKSTQRSTDSAVRTFDQRSGSDLEFPNMAHATSSESPNDILVDELLLQPFFFKRV